MLLTSIAAFLSVVSIAAEPPAETARDHGTTRLARVDATGAVAVSSDLGISWTTLMRCPRGSESPLLHDDAPPSAAAATWEDEPSVYFTSSAPMPTPLAHITWFEGALYLACTDGPLHRWYPTRLGASAPVRVVMAGQDNSTALMTTPMAVSALGSGQRLWIVDRHGQLWSRGSKPGLVRIGTVPEPVSAVTELQGRVVIAGRSAIWQYEGSWSPVLVLRARGLAATGTRLWLAGTQGLLILDQDRVRTLSIAPLTGVAVANGIVWMADGRRLRARAAPAHPQAARPANATEIPQYHDRTDTGRHGDSSAPWPRVEQRSDWQIAARSLETRMRWAYWLPRLSVELSGAYESRSSTSLVSHISSRATIVLWLKLSWSIDTSGHGLDTLQRSLL